MLYNNFTDHLAPLLSCKCMCDLTSMYYALCPQTCPQKRAWRQSVSVVLNLANIMPTYSKWHPSIFSLDTCIDLNSFIRSDFSTKIITKQKDQVNTVTETLETSFSIAFCYCIQSDVRKYSSQTASSHFFRKKGCHFYICNTPSVSSFSTLAIITQVFLHH